MQPTVVSPGTEAHQVVAPETHPDKTNFAGQINLPPAIPPQPIASAEPMPSDRPIAVVQALSVRGVEYTMMSLCLWFGAAGLIWILLSIINGGTSFDMLSLPAAILIVTVPIFALLFIRLKKHELADPELRLDPSKRRLSQFTQIFAFAACLFNLIAFIYEVMQKMGGRFSGSIGKLGLDILVVFVIAGGVLIYYWVDEHRLLR